MKWYVWAIIVAVLLAAGYWYYNKSKNKTLAA